MICWFGFRDIFCRKGVNATCVEVDEEKINSLLRGNIPIYGPGLDEMVLRNNREGRLRFTTDITTCLNKVDIVCSAVGIPPDEDASAVWNMYWKILSAMFFISGTVSFKFILCALFFNDKMAKDKTDKRWMT